MNTAAPAPVPKVSQVVDDTVAHATASPAVKSVVDQATTTASQATEPVVHATTTTVNQTAEPVVHATTTTVTQTVDPVVSAAGGGSGGGGSAVTQVADTVTSTVSQAAAPVRPVVDTVAAVSSGAARVADPVVSGPVAPGTTGGLVDAVAGAPAQVVALPGATVQTAREGVASAVAGGTPVADAASSVTKGPRTSVADVLPQAASGPRVGLADVVAPSASSSHAGLADALAASAGAHGVVAPPAGASGLAASPFDPGSLAAPSPATTSLLTHATSAPAPGGAAHGTAADALAQVATDPRLLVVTGVTALAGTAYVAARGAGCVAGGDPGVILNNVRLIPCLVKSGITSGGTAMVGLGAGVRDAAGSASTATRAGIEGASQRVSKAAEIARQDLLDHVIDPFHDGVARATGDPRGTQGAAGTDLFFLGIGLVVGLLYAAILSLWLFFARPRWSTRP